MADQPLENPWNPQLPRFIAWKRNSVHPDVVAQGDDVILYLLWAYARKKNQLAPAIGIRGFAEASAQVAPKFLREPYSCTHSALKQRLARLKKGLADAGIADLLSIDLHGLSIIPHFCPQAFDKRQEEIKEFEKMFGKPNMDLLDRFEPKDLPPPTVGTLGFFDPGNQMPVYLVTNLMYRYNFTFYKAKTARDVSTTTQFSTEITQYCTLLRSRGAISRFEHKHPNRLKGRVLRDLLAANANLISYASSKINPCTKMILSQLDRQYGHILRFASVDKRGRVNMNRGFRNPKASDKVALVWQSQITKHVKTEIDYGLIVKAHPAPKDPRVWFVFAGCSRPGSVAARKLVCDPEWSKALFDKMKGEGTDSFVTVYSVEYDDHSSDNPRELDICDFKALR
jgi:hypothetical protein